MTKSSNNTTMDMPVDKPSEEKLIRDAVFREKFGEDWIVEAKAFEKAAKYLGNDSTPFHDKQRHDVLQKAYESFNTKGNVFEKKLGTTAEQNLWKSQSATMLLEISKELRDKAHVFLVMAASKRSEARRLALKNQDEEFEKTPATSEYVYRKPNVDGDVYFHHDHRGYELCVDKDTAKNLLKSYRKFGSDLSPRKKIPAPENQENDTSKRTCIQNNGMYFGSPDTLGISTPPTMPGSTQQMKP